MCGLAHDPDSLVVRPARAVADLWVAYEGGYGEVQLLSDALGKDTVGDGGDGYGAVHRPICGGALVLV
eukprot:scaffold26298_cov27-Phaeocystis_antarctica.AAC.1